MTPNLTLFVLTWYRFRPLKRGEDREKLKERLANKMTYGDVEQKPPSPPRLMKQKPKLPTKKEQWNDCKFVYHTLKYLFKYTIHPCGHIETGKFYST